MKNRRLATIIACAAICAGALLMAIGVNKGENREIFNKGVNVCLECIGIG